MINVVEQFKVPQNAKATIEAKVTINTLTRNEVWKYRLVNLEAF